MSAPASSSTLKPDGFSDGKSTPIAGRFTPGALRRQSMASAISAPVLPQEIATVEAPSRTAVRAFHMLEPSARRSAREGFSSISMTLSAWRTSVRSASGVPGRIARSRSVGVAVGDEAQARVRLQRLAHAADDVVDPAIAAHGVDRDDDVTARPLRCRSGQIRRSCRTDLRRDGDQAASSSRSTSSTCATTSRPS